MNRRLLVSMGLAISLLCHAAALSAARELNSGGVPQQSVFKLVFNARSGRVLGVHLMDGAAPEIVQTMALALRLGVKASHLKTTMPLHPTVAEELFG